MANPILNYYLKIAKAANRYLWSENAVKERPFHIKYLFVIFLVIIATFIKLYFYKTIGGQTPFLLYFGVIILSAGFGGIIPAIFATVLSALVACYFFLPPYRQIKIDNPDIAQVFVFVGESLFLIALSGAVTRANRIVKNANERFKSLIENIHDAIFVIDPNGKILYVSPTIEKLLGYDKRQFKVLELSTIIDKDHVAELRKKYVDMIKTDGKSFTLQCKVLNKNGEWVWVDGTFANLLNHPSVRGVVCNFRNITERVFLEKQKDDFISIATHELKTPVTSIKAYAQILLKRFNKEGNDSAANMIAKMDGQLNKLISLIGDLLDVTKIEGGRLQLHEEFYEFNALIKELVEELQRTTDDHKIIMNLADELKIYGDRERVGQVFTNLISNAIKYSPSSGDIVITASGGGENVTVCVKDSGVGISGGNQSKVFERFYRVSGPENQTFPGLGLGLYISQEIIKRQGGKIWVESEKDKGSTFCFQLPIDYRLHLKNNKENK